MIYGKVMTGILDSVNEQSLNEMFINQYTELTMGACAVLYECSGIDCEVLAEAEEGEKKGFFASLFEGIKNLITKFFEAIGNLFEKFLNLFKKNKKDAESKGSATTKTDNNDSDGEYEFKDYDGMFNSITCDFNPAFDVLFKQRDNFINGKEKLTSALKQDKDKIAGAVEEVKKAHPITGYFDGDNKDILNDEGKKVFNAMFSSTYDGGLKIEGDATIQAYKDALKKFPEKVKDIKLNKNSATDMIHKSSEMYERQIGRLKADKTSIDKLKGETEEAVEKMKNEVLNKSSEADNVKEVIKYYKDSIAVFTNMTKGICEYTQLVVNTYGNIATKSQNEIISLKAKLEGKKEESSESSDSSSSDSSDKPKENNQENTSTSGESDSESESEASSNGNSENSQNDSGKNKKVWKMKSDAGNSQRGKWYKKYFDTFTKQLNSNGGDFDKAFDELNKWNADIKTDNKADMVKWFKQNTVQESVRYSIFGDEVFNESEEDIFRFLEGDCDPDPDTVSAVDDLESDDDTSDIEESISMLESDDDDDYDPFEDYMEED